MFISLTVSSPFWVPSQKLPCSWQSVLPSASSNGWNIKARERLAVYKISRCMIPQAEGPGVPLRCSYILGAGKLTPRTGRSPFLTVTRYVASLGALVVLTSFGFDPFLQTLVIYPQRIAYKDSTSALVQRAEIFNDTSKYGRTLMKPLSSEETLR
jgi:hypothetical protein